MIAAKGVQSVWSFSPHWATNIIHEGLHDSFKVTHSMSDENWAFDIRMSESAALDFEMIQPENKLQSRATPMYTNNGDEPPFSIWIDFLF